MLVTQHTPFVSVVGSGVLSRGSRLSGTWTWLAVWRYGVVVDFTAHILDASLIDSLHALE